MSEVPRPGAPEQQPFSANSLLSDVGDAVLKVELGQLNATEALAELKLLAGIYFSEKKAGKTFDKDIELAIQTELRKLKAEADKLTAATSATSPAAPAPATPIPTVHTPPTPPTAAPPRAATPLPIPTPPPAPRATAAPPPAAGGPPATPGTPEAPDPTYLAILARIRAFQSTIDSIVDATPPNATDAARALQELIRFRREIPGLSSRGRNKEAADLKTRLDELDAAYKADLEAMTAAKPKEEQGDLERELNAAELFDVLFSRMFTDGDITTTKELIYEKVIKQKVEKITKDVTNNIPGERVWTNPERTDFETLILESVIPLMEFGVFKTKTINTWDVTVQDPDVLLDAIGVAAGSTEANAKLNDNKLVGSTFRRSQIDRHQYRSQEVLPPPPPLRADATEKEKREYRDKYFDEGMGPIQEICCVMYSLMSTIGSEGGFDVSAGRYSADQSQRLVDFICSGREFDVEIEDGTIIKVNPGESLRHIPAEAKKIIKRLALLKASRDDLAQKASNKIMAFEGKSAKINGGSNAKGFISGYIARAIYEVANTANNGEYMFFFSYADPSRMRASRNRKMATNFTPGHDKGEAFVPPQTPLDFSHITRAKVPHFNLTVLDGGYMRDLDAIEANKHLGDKEQQDAKLARAQTERAERSLTIRQKMNVLDANYRFLRDGFDRRAINVELQNWDDDFPSIEDFTNRASEPDVSRSASEYKMARDAFKAIIDSAYSTNSFIVSHDSTSARKDINTALSKLLTQYAKMVAYMGTGVVKPGAKPYEKYAERYNSYHKLARGAIKVSIMNMLIAVPGELKTQIGSGSENREIYERRKIVYDIVKNQIDNYPSIATGIDVDLSSLHKELIEFLAATKSWLINAKPVNKEDATMDYNLVRIENTPELQGIQGSVSRIERQKSWSKPF